MNTLAEENYLKAIFKLSGEKNEAATTNAIAEELNTKASSVTDMIKKLTDKSLVKSQKYQGTSLTNKEEKLLLILLGNIVYGKFFWSKN